MATFYDTISIRLTADDSALRARLAQFDAEVAARVGTVAPGIATITPGGTLTTPARGIGARATANAAAFQATALTLSPNVRVANARGSISAPVVSQIAAGTAQQAYTLAARAMNGTSAAGISIATAMAGRPSTPPAAVQFQTGPAAGPAPTTPPPRPGIPGNTGTVAPGAVGIPGPAGVAQNYVPTKPTVPGTLKAPPAATAVAYGLGAGRVTGLAKKLSNPRMAGAVGLAAVFAAAKHRSDYNNEYFRELMTTPGSAPDYAPVSDAWDQAWDALGSVGAGITSAATTIFLGLNAITADTIALLTGASDETRRNLAGKFHAAGEWVKDTLGLNHDEIQAVADKNVARIRAYGNLIKQVDKEAKRAAEAMMASAMRMGFGGANTPQDLAGVFANDPHFKNGFLRDKARQFWKDNPLDVLPRMADPYGVTRQ